MSNYILYQRDPALESAYLIPSREVNLIEVTATILNRQLDINDFRICEADTAEHTRAVLASTAKYSLDWDEGLEEFWRLEAKPLFDQFANLIWEGYSEALDLLNEPLEEIVNIVRSSQNFGDMYVDISGYLDNVLESYRDCNEEAFFDTLTKKFNFKTL